MSLMVRAAKLESVMNADRQKQKHGLLLQKHRQLELQRIAKHVYKSWRDETRKLGHTRSRRGIEVDRRLQKKK